MRLSLALRVLYCVSDIIRFSKLTVADSQNPGEPIRPPTLTRVREPVSRSKSVGVQGKVADVLHGRLIAPAEKKLLAGKNQ
jgi:hypothetical protein